MRRTETGLEATKKAQEVREYLHGVESPEEGPHGASIGRFRNRRREAQARTRMRIRESGDGG